MFSCPFRPQSSHTHIAVLVQMLSLQRGSEAGNGPGNRSMHSTGPGGQVDLVPSLAKVRGEAGAAAAAVWHWLVSTPAGAAAVAHACTAKHRRPLIQRRPLMRWNGTRCRGSTKVDGCTGPPWRTSSTVIGAWAPTQARQSCMAHLFCSQPLCCIQMAQNLDLRCVFVLAPWVLGAKTRLEYKTRLESRIKNFMVHCVCRSANPRQTVFHARLHLALRALAVLAGTAVFLTGTAIRLAGSGWGSADWVTVFRGWAAADGVAVCECSSSCPTLQCRSIHPHVSNSQILILVKLSLK